jgi:hypothetical protein
MNNYEEQVRKIVSLKRYEIPRDGYFEDFLEEFQQRQRRELLQKSSMSLFLERASTWLREVGSVKWIAGAGVAYAALMVAILLWPAGPGTVPDANRVPASLEGVQSPVTPPIAPLEEPEEKLETKF